MERLTPKAFFFSMLFFSIFSLTATAQTKENKVEIKEWLIANRNNVTLISSKEYQQMSPSVRTVLDANKQTLVYNQTVTQNDLEAFEQKNDKGSYISFETISEKYVAKNASLANVLKTEEENKYELSKWLKVNQKSNIKIISRQNYESRPLEERTYIDGLENKIIYEGVALTLEEAKAFDQKKH
jgi:hypothetical protein